jgi:hypothetical protein
MSLGAVVLPAALSYRRLGAVGAADGPRKGFNPPQLDVQHLLFLPDLRTTGTKGRSSLHGNGGGSDG